MTPNLAGFWRRAAAALLDMLTLFVISLVINFIIRTNLASIISSLISLTYYIYFIGSRGQTPGKMALKIQVVRTDNQPMTYKTALLREVVGKFLSGLVLAVGYLWMIWDKDKQTWHDHLAKTQVARV